MATQSGKTAHEWRSQAAAFFQWSFVESAPAVAAGGAKLKTADGNDFIVDGDDAWALGFVLVPVGGTGTLAVERSLDGGQTWVVVSSLALTGATSVEKIETAPIGLYRFTVSAVVTSVAVRVRKKVALAR